MQEFEEWNKIKINLDQRKNRPSFSLREIWWCALGKNVGDEQNGKGKQFSRPVLITKKLNNHIFIGLALTTQNKDKPYLHKFNFQNKEISAILSQIKLIDGKRLISRIGRLDEKKFEEIRNKAKEYVF